MKQPFTIRFPLDAELANREDTALMPAGAIAPTRERDTAAVTLAAEPGRRLKSGIRSTFTTPAWTVYQQHGTGPECLGGG